MMSVYVFASVHIQVSVLSHSQYFITRRRLIWAGLSRDLGRGSVFLRRGSWVSITPKTCEQLGRPRRLFVVRLCGRGTIAPPREQPANMSRLLDTKKGQRRQKYEFCVVPPPCRNRPIYSVARATGWPRPAEARGSLRRDLAPRGTPLRASFWPKTVPPCVRHRCSACERRHGKTGCCGAAWPKSPA